MVRAASTPGAIYPESNVAGGKATQGMGGIMPTGLTSPAIPNGSCGPQVLVATIVVGVQGDPWHG